MTEPPRAMPDSLSSRQSARNSRVGHVRGHTSCLEGLLRSLGVWLDRCYSVCMSEANVSVQKRHKGRSPAYPAISLDLAIERAQIIWDRERRHPAAIPVIQSHWGVKAGSGSANVAIAALKRFGLLSDDGQGERRTGRLTDLAVEILLSTDPDQADHRHNLIRTAALLPVIHHELWEKYGGALPSDANLIRELVMGRNFTHSGANEFISQFRKTLAYAGLDEQTPPSPPQEEHESLHGDHLGREEGRFTVQPEPQGSRPQPLGRFVAQPQATAPPPLQRPVAEPVPGVGGGAITIPILLPGASPVHITGHFPITEAAWKQLMVVLEAMKGGLVAE